MFFLSPHSAHCCDDCSKVVFNNLEAVPESFDIVTRLWSIAKCYGLWFESRYVCTAAGTSRDCAQWNPSSQAASPSCHSQAENCKDDWFKDVSLFKVHQNLLRDTTDASSSKKYLEKLELLGLPDSGFGFRV